MAPTHQHDTEEAEKHRQAFCGRLNQPSFLVHLLHHATPFSLFICGFAQDMPRKLFQATDDNYASLAENRKRRCISVLNVSEAHVCRKPLDVLVVGSVSGKSRGTLFFNVVETIDHKSQRSP